MTAPVITFGTAQAGTNGSSVGELMPGSIGAGDLLLVFHVSDTTASVSASGGFSTVVSITNVVRVTVFGKIAAGGDTCTVTGPAEDFITSPCKITGHGLASISDASAMFTSTTGNDTSGDPPNLDLGYSADVLWIAFLGMDSNITAPITTPSGYTDRGNGWSNGDATSVAYGIASKTSTAQTENPGPWTLSGASPWGAITLGIPNIISAPSVVTTAYRQTTRYF